jgi:glutamate-1-semialdehyde 2,1-aminomutase
MSERYKNSEAMLARALTHIPLGSQTFSKSRTQYPFGVSPYFIQKGSGSRVWDVDGNEYLDFVSGLASITLGYSDPDVDAAVKAQLEEGVIFSLAHPIEVQVAEKICEMVPCAEMVRFGKNGSDATAGAVRVARAFTGRDRVAVCGYHGWQDWYIGATARNLGVPQAVRDLTHNFPFNDLDALSSLLHSRMGEFAAVILEPMNVSEPNPGYLQAVKDLAHKHGAVLIFDETITGFRFANGGAQELFGVTPDLATFGKGLANGYPLSAVAGRADIMALMEEIFFSFTFGGETLSLAASLATMNKLQNRPVVETLNRQGTKVIKALGDLIKATQADSFLSVSGHPSWSFLLLKDTPKVTSWELKSLYMQEMLARGILSLGSHNINYAHTDDDVLKLTQAYSEVVPMLVRALDPEYLRKQLRCEPLQPLFKVR